MPTSLPGIAKKAARHQGYRFRHRDGMLDEAGLKQGWQDIRQDAASGVDHGSAHASEQHLDENVHHLVARLKQTRYRAKLLRRHSLPKGDGPQRALGIPAVEDNLRQLAVARRLGGIYAQDFRRGRYGYRPQVGALEAVDTRTIKRRFGRYAGGLEADITKCVDPIDHDWRGRMVAERIDDGARRRVIQKGLKAGGLDTDGQVLHPVTGSPQGGTSSPRLAPVFLHDVLDLWCAPVGTQHCRGEAGLIR